MFGIDEINTMKMTCIVFILLVALSAMAQTPFGSMVNHDGTVTITNYTGTGGALIIPDSINGAPVTGIGNNAFHGKPNDPAYSGITEVVIGANVTWIGNRAFENCAGIKLISFSGAHLTRIGTAAFRHCEKIKSITIPNNVTEIGEEAFDDCFGLEHIDIPNTVTTIGNYAFYCAALTNAVLPEGVKTISKNAFEGCSKLRSISIPASVTSFGPGLFNGCGKLSDVFFAGNAPTTDIFKGAPKLIVHYRAGTSGWGPTFQNMTTQVSSP